MTPKAYSYIRFSTPEQLNGDSLRRQLEASEKYAKDKGLVLDTSLNLQDLGLSAYHGEHRKKGALGEFLKAVESGKVEKGSVLIVEHLDRLSREEVNDAYDQFRSITRAGIKIVTLQDGIEYTKDGNFIQLIMSIVYMSQANQESAKKSIRLRSAWEQKRKEAVNENLKLSKRAPLWLQLLEDKKTFVPIPEAVKTIEMIFKMKLAGIGKRKIEKELNQMEDSWKPPYNKKRLSSGWRHSYIQKILTSKSVIGEFTMHRKLNLKEIEESPEKKKIEEQTITDYFPPIIDKELFYGVQSLMKENAGRNGNSGGRTGKAKNLFAHIAKCGLCKSPMHFIDKGQSPKGGQYLICDSSQRKLGCDAKAIRYDEFEHLFFEEFEELNISELLPNPDEIRIQENQLQEKLRAHTQHLAEINSQIENFIDSIGNTKDARIREALEGRFTKALNEKEELEKSIQLVNNELQNLSAEIKEFQKSRDTSKEVYDLLRACKDESEQINLRYRLRTEIRKLVSSIEIYPLMETYKHSEEVESGIFQIMDSKYIDRFRIRFNGSKKKSIVYLKSAVET